MTLTDFIGIPYEQKGRTLEGVDCWGLVWIFYREILNISVPSYSDDYADSEDHDSVSDAILHFVPRWEPVKEKAYGDVLVFNILGHPIHTGIYLGGNDFVHAFKNTNSCIERLDSINWNRRLQGVYRWEKT